MRVNKYVLGVLVLVLLFLVGKELVPFFKNILYPIIGVLVLLLSYFIYKSIRLIGELERLERVILSLKSVSKESLNRLKFLDEKNFFSATQETVLFFENLKTIQNVIDSYLGDNVDDEEKEK